MTVRCRDAEDGPDDCQKIADPRYTMDFTDVKPGAYIYWCSVCGPKAHALDKALTHLLDTSPGFKQRFAREVQRIEDEGKPS